MSTTQPKPTRNPLKAGDAVHPPKMDKRPMREAPKPVVIDRKTMRTAKLSCVGLTDAARKTADIEYWVPEDHDYENLLEWTYWQSLVANFRKYGDYAGSIIHVRAKDHSYYAQLYVMEIEEGGIHVKELSKTLLGVQREDVKSTKFDIIWDDALKGYNIVRKADGNTIVSAKQMKRLDAVKEWLNRMEG